MDFSKHAAKPSVCDLRTSTAFSFAPQTVYLVSESSASPSFSSWQRCSDPDINSRGLFFGRINYEQKSDIIVGANLGVATGKYLEEHEQSTLIRLKQKHKEYEMIFSIFQVTGENMKNMGCFLFG
ncbi:hypothetical protein SUGI_0713120 [Cryptomeria japonica]|nr:hypothetical protein SUGI_0713120 [Cryptomeria japonica]